MSDRNSKKPHDDMSEDDKKNTEKTGRAALSFVGGAIPIVGGILSAAANAWSEHEQEQVNNVFKKWMEMLEEELKEKAQTIIEIMARVDMQDQQIADRISSQEFQDIIKKSFRNWSSIENEKKRTLVRNILANAATSNMSSDEVVKLFLDWLAEYSSFHFEVIGAIFQNPGISRLSIWNHLGREPVREDSADADLYKLLIRDLSTGGVIRQHRPTDAYGNFLPKERKSGRGRAGTMKSAFDDEEPYELTELGKEFVHYAMNELVPRIEYHPEKP